MKQNKFLELSSSPLMNLDHTYRYSGTKLVEAESLSQHIVDTIMIGIKIIDKINNMTEEEVINPSEYVMKAVYHDMEEAITGDIPRPLKYYNQDTLNSLRSVADQIASEFFSRQFESNHHYDFWDKAKEGDAGYILKLVDMLVVAHKVVKEVSLLNNYYMLRVAHEISQYLDEFTIIRHFEDPQINYYLESLIQDAKDAMLDIIEEHKEYMDKLNICAQSMI